jgi:hypothetical protein
MAASDFLNWEQLAAEHDRVAVHMHTPMTKQLGFPVYSVLAKNRVLGQVTGGALEEPSVKIDRKALQDKLNRDSKTRNTFIEGRPVVSPPEGESVGMRMRPGSVKVGDETVFEAKTGRGPVTVRQTIPKSERTPGGPTQRQSEPFEGTTVPPQPTRSDVFAAGAVFGREGVQAIVRKD